MDNVVIEKLFSTLTNERTNQTKYMNGTRRGVFETTNASIFPSERHSVPR
jgi:hypothetical protein